MTVAQLPHGMQLFERGWLSSNNLLCVSEADASLIDTGYVTHSAQTIGLVGAALAGRQLNQIACTHLHSDHCGGVAALSASYPAARVWIPPGEAELVACWDEDRLSYRATGQGCPRFSFHHLLEPGSEWRAGAFIWQVLAAPGHDTHSIVLFEPEHGVLISADALWEHGFGVVFPAIDGPHAFDDVSQTLDLIASLRVKVVIPGHGAVFTDVVSALARARARLAAFRADPRKHALHAGKVLVKFKLLELQRCRVDDLLDWITHTPNFNTFRLHYLPQKSALEFAHDLLEGLIKAGAARRNGDDIVNAER